MHHHTLSENLSLATNASENAEHLHSTTADFWVKFWPYFITAIAFYGLLSVAWILWNIYAYRRDLSSARKGQFVGRLHEKWRLLSVYDQIPHNSKSVASDAPLISVE
ncbi:hypothetical protein niasHT_024479 [Heterodera trifolii]|uniref:ATP synthase F0 subunit 8 n=1 Tax=Heterodera trifolii TaxID=157864 RepID=A0ABD2K7N5_9BILA